MWQVTRDLLRWSGCPRELKSRHTPRVPRHPQRGIALIITLIMLAVTLVMAVAFLALSRRERNAVSTTTDTATARLATDSALAAAQAQIAASILATNTGAYNYHLLVSTNYINAYGFVPGVVNVSNVNYDYYDPANGGGPLNNDVDRNQNMANLELMPRAPVYVVTNQQTGAQDFRYYLDMNRNAAFEDTGSEVPQVVMDLSGNPFTNGFAPEVGDPQWIGVLEHPDQPHGPNNHFIARYAFFAQPIGNSLDLNYIHNQTLNTSLGSSDGFFRNEGVGSWELNLAAFLADLNTNIWSPVFLPDSVYYAYNEPYNNNNAGLAFDDARSLLSWRYDNTYNSLAIPPAYFQTGLYNEGIDGYSVGNLMFNASLPSALVPAVKNWAGSDNTNKFFTLSSDLFDPNKSSPNFTNRLQGAGNSTTTYGRYTFYRMLDQLGTDSTVDEGRMNLNYRNVTNGVVVAGMETNMYPWMALDFFTNAADRLLRHYSAKWFASNPSEYMATYYDVSGGNMPGSPGYYYYLDGLGKTNVYDRTGLGLTNVPVYGMTNEMPVISLTNIPVYLDGRFVYSPAINRLLQLAANLYDASTNKAFSSGKDFPSVFRPLFTRVNTNLYVSGYTYVPIVNGSGDIAFSKPFPASQLALTGGVNVQANVFGVPWIIGARKGFPNFNQFYMLNMFQLTRKLQVSRPSTSYLGATATNQLFTMSVTNMMGFSFWNSYDTNYVPAAGLGNLHVYLYDWTYMSLSNGAAPLTPIQAGTIPPLANPYFATNVNLSYWPGSGWALSGANLSPLYQKPQSQSFVSGQWNFPFLPEANYEPITGNFTPLGSSGWINNPYVAPFPQMLLATTNWIQAFILDGNNHVIDYVQLSGPSGIRNLSDEVADSPLNATDAKAMTEGTAMWDTNLFSGANGPTKGVVNQIEVSRFNPSGAISTFWKQPANTPSALNTPEAEAGYFNAFFTGDAYIYRNKVYYNTNLVIQAPYTPTRTAWQYTSWQANDPLVHYLASDLNTITKETGLHHADVIANSDFPKLDLNAPGVRYQPWGLNAQMNQVSGVSADQVDANAYNVGYRDPLSWRSDNWDFPAGKYPSVGWFGRVHRGTPWQTVYLKSTNVLAEMASTPSGTANVGVATWAQWTGD
ncbi:MAG TPA: hypothetical protein VFF11_02505, partial [Candidatus Binatia bacterium]|nr:hypothetical protein [Candidatus Binatia bacterium]